MEYTHIPVDAFVGAITRINEDDDYWEDGRFTLDRAYPYSGMQICAALRVGNFNDGTRVLTELATDADNADLARGLARSTRSDSLGLGYVFYWPGFMFEGALCPFDEEPYEDAGDEDDE